MRFVVQRRRRKRSSAKLPPDLPSESSILVRRQTLRLTRLADRPPRSARPAGTTAVVLVGCGPSEADRVADRTLIDAAYAGNVEAVKQHLAAGTDVNAKDDGLTPLHEAITVIFA